MSKTVPTWPKGHSSGNKPEYNGTPLCQSPVTALPMPMHETATGGHTVKERYVSPRGTITVTYRVTPITVPVELPATSPSIRVTPLPTRGLFARTKAKRMQQRAKNARNR